MNYFYYIIIGFINQYMGILTFFLPGGFNGVVEYTIASYLKKTNFLGKKLVFNNQQILIFLFLSNFFPKQLLKKLRNYN